MKLKLLFRLCILLGIVLLGSYVALRINPDYNREYVAATISKMEKLKKVEVRKIVIVGGSNASFGIDTDLMEQQLNIPVVNMALHGGLPVKYIIEQVKRNLNKGDILIFSKEYEGLKDESWNAMNGMEVSKVPTYYPSQAHTILGDRTLFESTVSGVFASIKKNIANHPIEGMGEINSVYDSRAFKRDNIMPEYIRGRYQQDSKERALTRLDKNSSLLKGLKEYKTYFDKKGILFYLTPPVVVKGYFKEASIMPFWNSFSAHTGIPLLSHVKNYTYAKKYFFNSHYHSNVIGRKIRTESLIEDIVNSGLLKDMPNNIKEVYVSNEKSINEARLASFTPPYNFEVLSQDSDHIKLKQSGSLKANYFRIQFENKDYQGYDFYLRLECDSTVIENIRFRGTRELVRFDTIRVLEDNSFELLKKVDAVLYTNNISYLGISFPENEDLIGKEFTIKEVGIYKDFENDDTLLNSYPMLLENGQSLFFEVLSSNDKISLTDVISASEDFKEKKINSNDVYYCEMTNGTIACKNFYSGEIIFKAENDITFISKDDHVTVIRLRS